MNKNNVLLALPLFLLAAVVGGCSAKTSDAPEPDTSLEASGLSIDEQRADLASGSFERDGITIGFEFHVADGVHHSKIWDESGVLLESTLSNDDEDTVYLGGKARVHGSLGDATPTIDGDPKIFDALNAHPSARLFFELKDALVAAHVSRDLFAAKRRQGDLSPLYLNRGSFTLPSGQSLTVGTTWQSWVYTQFTLWAAGWSGTTGCVQALTGWSAPVCNTVYLNQSAWTTGARYYGYSVKVSNPTVSLNGLSVDLGVNVSEW